MTKPSGTPPCSRDGLADTLLAVAAAVFVRRVDEVDGPRKTRVIVATAVSLIDLVAVLGGEAAEGAGSDADGGDLESPVEPSVSKGHDGESFCW